MNRQMKEFDYEYKKINSALIIKDSYQREVDFTRVKKIISNWNPNRAEPIKVSYRDGKYYVFDGQHTLRARVSRNKGHDLLVDCKVYYGMTFEDEAYLFAIQDDLKSNVSSAQKLKSLYQSNDIDVVEFKETVESCGITCDFGRNIGNFRLVCYSALYKVFIKQGRAHTTRLLKTITEIWNGESSSLRKEIILGMNIFITTYAGEYNEKTLVKKLSRVSPLVIVRDGNVSLRGGNKRYARVILQAYNQNASTNRLEDKI